MFIHSKSRRFFASDGDGGGSGGASSDGDNGEPTIAELKKQLADAQRKADEAIETRQTTKAKLKEAAAEAERLREELDAATRRKVEESGDIEKIRGEYAKDVEKEKLRAEAAEAKFKNSFIRSAFLEAAHGVVIPEMVDDVLTLLRGKIDVSKDGETIVIEGSTKSLKDFVKEYVDQKPGYAVNPATGGSGAGGGSSRGGGNGVDVTLEQIERMSPAEYNAAVRKNPKVAELYLQSRRRSG